MLQDIRQQVQGTTAKIVVGLIVISFAFFGIESILVGGGGNEIADVNGSPIYPQELEQAVVTQKRRLLSMMGQDLDPALLDDERLKPQALEALVNRKLLMQSAEEMQLAISNPEIGTVVGNMEQFQVDGVFSADVYKSVLSSAGYTPSYFKESLRDDMLLNQLRSGIAGSEFATPTELEVNTKILSEQRDLRYFTIPKEKYASSVEITDAEIAAYYDTHQEDFRTEESVDIDYLELNLDDFRQPVEESAVLEAFEVAKQESQFQAQNRVSHILFEQVSGDDAQQRLAKAQEALANGLPFAEAAKQFSDDVGSAVKGGDLGYSSGNTFPPAMEAAIAALEPNVVSAPIETEAGTHLLLVTERRSAEEPDLDDMRDQLEESIQTDEARVELLRVVESLRDLSFNAENLDYPAEELGLAVEQANAVTRSQKEGLFANSALVDAAFAEDVLVAGHNSEVIELSGNRFVVLNVRQHHTPEIKPLESIRDEVLAAVTAETARAAVQAAADQILAQLRAGRTLKQVANEEGYELQVELGVNRSSSTVPPHVLQRVFELPLPATDKTLTDFVVTSNGDAVVIELLRVNSGDYKSLSQSEQSQLEQMLSSEFGSLIDNEFQHGLRERAEITIL